ncbi:MAG: primase-helicase zinc-binding domain-containing protein, partial [Chloroflexota bacterium]
LLDLCPTPMKRAASTGGGEYHGPCPVCGGNDRFVIQPEADNGGRWFCRQCKRNGDTLAFCTEMLGDTFQQAMARLGTQSDCQPGQQLQQKKEKPPVSMSQQKADVPAADDAWQFTAAQFIYQSQNTLWSPAGTSARDYLYGRGLSKNVMSRAWLGYSHDYRKMIWGESEVKLPRGLIIPWLANGSPRKVKVRRRNYDIEQQRARLMERGTPPENIKIAKYVQAAGGFSHDLYMIEKILARRPVVMVETELDALMLQSLFTRFTAVAVGSASDGLTQHNAALLATAKHVYCGLDGDPAGYNAYLKWRYALGAKHITRLVYEQCSDPGEIYQQFGTPGLTNWLAQVKGLADV